ncbi:unnamed protein product (mitochondrion) [Plasmodiophora brassicae]|uniref:Uncharacterized protein n=1 Tax=Plasmodiophora brassicae TaxID=37360 RepID=A0A0G4J5R1_PLABS|nr:hypothetical protein PBRA_009166 [Plasmodiophora brassicae]SPR01559.1 unnamed protein product [Plasmodiophora brassicae]
MSQVAGRHRPYDECWPSPAPRSPTMSYHVPKSPATPGGATPTRPPPTLEPILEIDDDRQNEMPGKRDN